MSNHIKKICKGEFGIIILAVGGVNLDYCQKQIRLMLPLSHVCKMVKGHIQNNNPRTLDSMETQTTPHLSSR